MKVRVPHRFRVSETVAEGFRNGIANRWLLAVRIALAVSLTFAACGYALIETNGIEDRFRQQVDAGRFAWRVEGGSGAAVLPAGRCDALGTIDGVHSSGAALDVASVSVSTKPLASYELWHVTPGYLQVLWPDIPDTVASSSGLFAGSLISQEVGLVPGASIQLESRRGGGSLGAAPVAAVMSPSERDSGADRRLYVTAAPQGFAANCLVDASPGQSPDIGVVLRSWFSQASSANVFPFVNDELGRTPEDELATRASRFVWLGSAGFLAVVTLLVWYTRRADLALYRLLGMTASGALLMWYVDALLLVLLPTCIGMTASLVVFREELSELSLRLVALDGLTLAAIVLLIPAASALMWGRGSTLRSLKGA